MILAQCPHKQIGIYYLHVNLACTYIHYLMYEKDKLPKIISMKYEPSNFQTLSKNNNKDVSIA